MAESTPSNLLRSRALRGLSWTAVEGGALQGIQLLVGVILARLLLPEQFGLVAMITVVIAVSQTVLDSGFSSALIQKKDASHRDECSVFYINLLLGVVLAAGLCLASPYIAAFYQQPELRPLTCALSSVLVIRSFALVQRTMMTKRLDFKSQAKAAVAAAVVSGAVGVSLAISGFGVWALVAQQISAAAVQTALYWGISSWRPSLVFSFASLRELFGFGSRMLAAGLLDSGFHNLHALVIGRVFSAADLGYYDRGRDLAMTPGRMISSILNRVAFPVLAQVQDDRERLVRATRKALMTLAFVSVPALVGLAVVARPLIIVVFTERWLPTVPLLQLLCVAGALYPLHAIHLNVLKAIGRSDLFLRLEVIKKFLLVANILFFLPFGLLPLIAGQAALSLLAYALNGYYTGSLLHYGFRRQVIDLAPTVAAAAVMGGAIYLLGYLPFSSEWLRLVSQVASGVVIYLLLASLLRLTPFLDLLAYARMRLWPRSLVPQAGADR